MASLSYVGIPATAARDIATRASAEAQFAAGVSRGYVTGRVATLAAGKGTKVYVDNQDALYAPNTYPPTKDALLVPISSKAQVNGVASLDSAGDIPLAQTPVLGAGILAGPWGHIAGFTVTTGATPLKFADIFNGQTGFTGQLMIFMTVLVIAETSTRPVIEVRYSTSGGTTYASQTLVAAGWGRSFFGDSQTVSVFPVAALNEGQDGLQDSIANTANLKISAWLYDGAASGGQVNTQAGYIVSSAMYVARTTL